MAQDPAFLFYVNDFDTGTKFFSDEQVGKYLRLLIAQFQHGHLNERQVLFICKTYDDDIMKKFCKDDEGNFFNQRLEDEIQKRRGYSLSRSNNRKAKKTEDIKNICQSYDSHMEDENENENEIRNKTIKVNFLNFSDDFKKKWAEWKEYKKIQHKFTYKLKASEQSAIKKLYDIARGNEQTAVKIIDQSIANGWKGFFEVRKSDRNPNDRDEDRIDYWNDMVQAFGTDEEKESKRINRS
jgi:uncharacterized protein YdaU (DUF1376 family)